MKFKLSSPELDKWNGEDKVLHFSLSAAMAFNAAVLFHSLHFSEYIACAFAVSILVGFAKEIKDAMTETGSGFSYKDLTADALGSALGVAFAASFIA